MTHMKDAIAGRVDRRTVLLGVGAVGAAGALAACSSADTSDSAPPQDGASSPSPDGMPRAAVIAMAADVPVGGGLVVEDKMVVVTQPTQGEFRAFTSQCPHQGCTVGEVTEQEIICPCHNSRFSTTTGEVLQGPAAVGLTPVAVSVDGREIVSRS